MEARKNVPSVYILIINWNGGEMIKKCIESLKITSYQNYKIVLVDNASEDNSIEELKKISPEIQLIQLNKNYGCSPARNIAMEILLKNKEMDYICFMDSDIITIQEDWLDVQVKEMEKDKSYGISGGKLVFPDNRLQIIARKDRSHFNEKDEGQYNFVTETEAVWGACMLIKKSVIENIGYLDENFFYGPDDIDYCYRARKSGFKVLYNGLSKSIHIGSYSGLSSRKDMIYLHQSYGMMIYAFRHLETKQKIAMFFRQLIRAIITRKDPFSKFSITNKIWHFKSFPKRFIYFWMSFFKAIKNYKIINKTIIKDKIIKKK